jgi:hypothetical protein
VSWHVYEFYARSRDICEWSMVFWIYSHVYVVHEFYVLGQSYFRMSWCVYEFSMQGRKISANDLSCFGFTHMYMWCTNSVCEAKHISEWSIMFWVYSHLCVLQEFYSRLQDIYECFTAHNRLAAFTRYLPFAHMV